jgi:SagB-type dehydrogenase family enzyme
MTGAAIRSFLSALDQTDGTVTPGEPTTAFKRYVNTRRTPLRHDGRRDSIGSLLCGLLGVTRVGWDHTVGAGTTTVVQGRPVPSGGAKYPIEAYVADDTGLYHYDPAHHALEEVRRGDHRPALTGHRPDLVIVLTAVFWRTGIRYGDFAYRLQCQETGALAAQFLALIEAEGRSGTLMQCFDVSAAGRLLGLDPEAEGVMAILRLSRSGNDVRAEDDGGSLAARTTAEIADPPPSVAATLPHLLALHTAPPSGDQGPPPPLAPTLGPELTLSRPRREVLLRDGVAARESAAEGFDAAPIEAERFGAVLAAAERGYASALPGTADGPATCALYTLAVRVQGVPPGGYRYHRGRLTSCGREPLALPTVHHPALSELAFGEAAAVILPVGDPLGGVAQYGDAWYRIQHTEAGLIVHRATLAAASLGLTSRIHSDFCRPATDAALGLDGSPWRALSALFIGAVPARRTPRRWTMRSDGTQ